MELIQLMTHHAFEYAAITNQIGEVRRIATFRAYHNGKKKQLTLCVATVQRPLTKVSDYTLGAFSDSRYGTFFFDEKEELRQMQREGMFMSDFLDSLEPNDRQALEKLFVEYTKESNALTV